MNNLIKLLVLILMVGACSPTYMQYSKAIPAKNLETKVVWIDTRFSENEKIEIKSAILEWENSLPGTYSFYIKEDFNMEIEQLNRINYDWFILKKSKLEASARGIDKDSITLAYANEIGGNIIVVIDDRSKNKKLKSIIMHEIGHLLGLHHIENSLMNSYYNGLECVDKNTAKALSTVIGLEMSNIRYCY